ncbi:DoxX family protein [Mangrovimonas sp. AS39]|uniref:DoxX family protein n=1 Tax=Mangrovimonas futianensis TaxID=2895523 RepID=UPI001E4E85DA|nr:DoxX family protein [Mangrovimonas futianensis]MCF1192253.1 DoxX family protein [Mangrovimonas futianensis]MCF1195998.1 DoxX family protein [Mangrovimonas futianensis]
MMKKNFNDLALLILRVGFGGFMLTHGIPKMGMLSNPSDFGDPMGVGSTISLILALIGEVVAPILLIIGFKTKWAAIPAAITMAVAAFVVHAKDDLATKEHALLFLIAFVVIFLTGAGKYSIDKG